MKLMVLSMSLTEKGREVGALSKMTSMVLAAVLAACCFAPFSLECAWADDAQTSAETEVYLALADSALVRLVSQEGSGKVHPGDNFELSAEFTGCPEGAANYLWEVSTDGGVTWTVLDCNDNAYAGEVTWPVGTTVLFRVTATNLVGQSDYAEFILTVVEKASGKPGSGSYDKTGDEPLKLAVMAGAGTCALASFMILIYRRKSEGNDNE